MARRNDRGVSVGVVVCALGLAIAAPARADDDPAAADLVLTVKTAKPRAELSQFLVKDAEDAAKKRDWPHAVPIYEALVVARGRGSAEARKLADLWALAGQPNEAVAVLQDFIAATEDPAAQKEAKDALDRFQQNTADEAFTQELRRAPVDKDANEAFKRGRASFAKKEYGDALVYYTMGFRLAPDLPGFLRELAATYDKLGKPAEKINFYRAYLQRRPFGKNADDARKALGNDKKVLGTIAITASLPCDQVWIAGEEMPGKLPRKDLTFAPGTYRSLCVNEKYALTLFKDFVVTAGQTTALTFNWGIVVNSLQNPLGRILLEKARVPGTMVDLGVGQPEIGVELPDDGHALKLQLKSDDGTKSDERYVKITPGQRLVVQWKQ
jgi:tetratricopeptide (TPR) repeat protein